VKKLLITVAALALAAMGFVWMSWLRPGPSHQPVTLTVAQGSTLGDLAQQLEDKGLIRTHAAQWKMLARTLGSRDPIRAGEFAIPAGASGAEILGIVQHGVALQYSVTIPEGMPSILVQERIAALENIDGDAPLPDEGSVLPDTYAYQRGETRAQLVARMQAAMAKTLAELWEKRSPDAVVQTPEEAIILASIVEKETGKADERPLIAGVLSNRIRIGMMLGADATTIYPITKGKPLGRLIRKSELQDKNPYNTRAIAGLPIGPITNPGREAIAAVLNPAKTDALYYVADGSGGHLFARTLAEHEANAANWRALRRQRGEL